MQKGEIKGQKIHKKKEKYKNIKRGLNTITKCICLQDA